MGQRAVARRVGGDIRNTVAVGIQNVLTRTAVGLEYLREIELFAQGAFPILFFLAVLKVDLAIGRRLHSLSIMIIRSLNYKVTPRYNYIGVSALLKIYPWRKGFNISIGGRAGANLNGKGISYESNQEESKFANYHLPLSLRRNV